MARKKYTASGLKKAVEKYWASITVTKPMLVKRPVLVEKTTETGETVMVPELDKFGHEQVCYQKVITADGVPAMETTYTQPPSITGLCLYLGVDRSTFFRWTKLRENGGEITPEEEKICNIVTQARGRIEEYLIRQTENPRAARGAIANLEANFGWKRRREVGLDEETRAVAATTGMTMDDKLETLRRLGVLPETGGR